MGRCKCWCLLLATLYFLHLQHEGEGANRVVLDLELHCSPNKDNETSVFGHYCNGNVTYRSGEGKVPSRWPHVRVGLVGGDHFTYTINCSRHATLYRGWVNGSELLWEELGQSLQETVPSVGGSLHHDRVFQCISTSKRNHQKTPPLELDCITRKSKGPVEFINMGVGWINTGSSCASNKDKVLVDLLHLQSKVYTCRRCARESPLTTLENTITVRRFENVTDLPTPKSVTQSSTASLLPSTHAVTQSTPINVVDTALHNNADTSSVTNSNTLMVALSAAAAGVTGLVVVVLLIMWYRHHHHCGHHEGDQQMSTVRVATNLLRLPRRWRSRSNTYIGQDDRLLSDLEEASSPRAMSRYGTSSLHYSDQWEINRVRLTQLAPAGEGCYSKVFKCDLLAGVGDSTASSKVVAVKTAKGSSDRTGLQELVTEALVMRRVGNDEHVLKLLGVCTRGGPLSLVMEHAPFGNLRQYLRSRRPCDNDPLGVVSLPPGSNAIIMTEEILLRYSLQVAKGMKYLISKESLHCNLCARSVLVFDNDTLKLSNFGVVKESDYHDYYSGATPDLSPVKWQAPETFQRQSHSEYSDVWAFGITMWEIATLGGTPYPGVAIESLRDLIVQSGYRMQRPRNCSRRVYSLMTSCWMMSPYQRHRFFVLIVKILNLLSEIESERVPETPPVELEVVEVNGESSGHAG